MSTPLDDLVFRASRGDRHALARFAIVYGPTLVSEARELMAARGAPHAGDVVCDLLHAMLAATLEFVPGRDRAGPWLFEQLQLLCARRAAGGLPS